MANIMAMTGAIGLVLVAALALAPEPDLSDLDARIKDGRDIDGCWRGLPDMTSRDEKMILVGICKGLEDLYHKKHGRWHTRNGGKV